MKILNLVLMIVLVLGTFAQATNASARTYALEQSVQVQYGANSKLPLSALLKLAEWQGDRVLSVTLIASTGQGGSVADARLLVDGAQVGASTTLIGGNLQSYTFYLDANHGLVGGDFQSLEIALGGSVYVQSVSVQIALRPGGHHPPHHPGPHHPHPPHYPGPHYPYPYPYPYPYYSCSMSTPLGMYYGQGYDMGQAMGDTRNNCYGATGNSLMCNSVPVDCVRNY